MTRSVNVATPLEAVAVSVPLNVPVPVALLTVTTAEDDVTVFPAASTMRTTGWLVKADPETATDGSVVMAIASAASKYVKPDVAVALDTSEILETTTSCGPAVPAGVVAVIEVGELVKTVAEIPPIVTVASVAKSAPAIVIDVLPAVVPLLGVIPVMAGFKVPALALDSPTTLMPMARIPVSTARAILLEPNIGRDVRA